MLDTCHREINYLRVSITDRCNLRCVYCMPPEGVNPVSHEDVLRNEEIARLIKAGAGAGIRKVRLTGGEPLVRKGLVDLVAMINEKSEIDDIALTTNGLLLPAMGGELKRAGLCRVNISLDTLDPDMFRLITRNGDLARVWEGIETALDLGLHPVKINTVVMRGFNDGEVGELAALTLKYPLHVRFIELMPVGISDTWTENRHVPASEVRDKIESRLGRLEDAHRPSGNGPARYYRLSGSQGTIGFISAVSDHFCSSCNRLRLTAEGMLRPCLYSGREIDVRGPLRRGAGESDLTALFSQAVSSKPERHDMDSGWKDEKRTMSQIGG
ncbi:MAG: GTP 3',8-cyclase MoaA [Desulfocucumaceae bacterium]